MKGLWMHDDETMCSRAGCQHSEHTTPPSTPSGERIADADFEHWARMIGTALHEQAQAFVLGEGRRARASEKALREALEGARNGFDTLAYMIDCERGRGALKVAAEAGRDTADAVLATLAKQP